MTSRKLHLPFFLVSFGIAALLLASPVTAQQSPDGDPGAPVPGDAPAEERALKVFDQIQLTVFGQDALGALVKIDSSGRSTFLW